MQEGVLLRNIRNMKKEKGTKHLDPIDDYELKPEYHFDYGKSKPNRFAGRVLIFKHGGVRRGAGRKRAPETVERHTITLYKSHVKYLRSLNPNLSQAIRRLIAKRAR